MLKIPLILVLGLLMTGCATKYTQGIAKTSYTPYSVGVSDDKSSVIVKGAEGTRFWQVDGKRIASIPEMMFGGGYDSIRLTPGSHSFSAARGVDIDVGKVKLELGNEYFLNHLQADKRIYY